MCKTIFLQKEGHPYRLGGWLRIIFSQEDGLTLFEEHFYSNRILLSNELVYFSR